MVHHYEDEIPYQNDRTPNELYEEVKEALDYAETPLEVESIFEKLKATENAETVKFVAEKLDKDQETQFRENIEDEPVSAAERKAFLAEAKEADAATDPDEIASLEADIDSIQIIAQIFLNIAKIRGDEASPVTKTFVEEMKKLSGLEYYSLSSLTQALFNVADKLVPAAKPTPKTNPFAALDKPPKAA